MNGSSMPFVEALEKQALWNKMPRRVYFELKDNLTYEDAKGHIEMLAVPQETFQVNGYGGL